MGVHSLFFALFHVLFWSKLNWKTELTKLSDVNNAVTQILNLRLIHVFIILVILCFTLPEELIQTPLGNALLLSASSFWLGRTIEQVVYRRLLPVSSPLSIFLTALFVVGIVGFLVPVII